MESGTRRFGQVDYVDVTETYAADRTTVDNNAGSYITNPGPNNDGVCGGDSGGALFSGNAVLGVTSGGVLNNGDENVCVRMRNANFISVPAYRDWIEAQIGVEADTPEIDDTLACEAFQLDQSYGLRAAGSYSHNWGGLGEKWVSSRNGDWFYILPAGELYRWNSNSTPPTGEHVATLTAAFHADPTLLHDAIEIEAGCPDNAGGNEAALAQQAYDLDNQYGFKFHNSYATNWGGLGEKWILGRDGSWFYITPTGAVTRWSNQRPVDGEVVGQLSAAYHVTPALLHDAEPQSLKVDVPPTAALNLRTMRTSNITSPQPITTTRTGVASPRNGSSPQAVSGSSSPLKAICTSGRAIPTRQQVQLSQNLALKCTQHQVFSPRQLHHRLASAVLRTLTWTSSHKTSMLS